MKLTESFEATGAGGLCLGTEHQADISVFLPAATLMTQNYICLKYFPSFKLLGYLGEAWSSKIHP